MTPAVTWGAAEVNCHTGGAWTSLHPPPASPWQPAVWGGSAVPIGGHGHQHLTLAHLLQGTGQAVEVPVILLESFPEVQDHTRGAGFGGKVVQVPGGGKKGTWAAPKLNTSRSLGGGEHKEREAWGLWGPTILGLSPSSSACRLCGPGPVTAAL